ncbi:LysR family transcriptional regulator [Photobacterium aquimaris]|uniref:HTH-type transcriptional regulator DmlR n=1 Tax=Photobacterium aquimaris TaxID=512643 RepID=A0A1Y6KWV6_9GAMM|nr:LysR family transcriptional regulator [Photobacterium aquimaris]SMY16663.1 HTH-type transcriptional regulator DmlR [Photobacterium aquimaris]
MDRFEAMKAFVRVVQTGSFSATGRELNTTQTTISKRIAALEKILGVQLLRRSSREHSLTPAGHRYFESCLQILAQVEETEANLHDNITQLSGHIRIAVPVAFGRILLTPLLPTFFAQYPNISIELFVSDRHVDLISEGVDLAIRARKLEDSNLVARHLMDNPLKLYASPHYLDRVSPILVPDDLSQHECLLYSRLTSQQTWTLKNDQQSYVVPVNGAFKCDDGDVLLEATLHGLGISIFPPWMASQALAEGKLIEVLPTYQEQTLPMYAVYPKDVYVPYRIQCFIDFLKQHLMH